MKAHNLSDLPVVPVVFQSGGADAEAQQLRNQILNAQDTLDVSGTVYYVSPCGDDTNDGKSPKTAKRSLLADIFTTDILKPGDAVLFERGGVWRANESVCCRTGITYGAYGTGKKPEIYGSVRNYAQAHLWKLISAPEMQKPIWRMQFAQSDAGVVVFNDGAAVGYKKGHMREVTQNGEFFHNTIHGGLYLYCDAGNPGEVFESIEIGTDFSIFELRGNDITIDNLSFKFTGKMAVDGTNVHGIRITNCEMGWIGGSFFRYDLINGGYLSRYGNAVQFWDSCEDIRVSNNWIYQVYDSGLTFQGSKGWAYNHKYRNVFFTGNLIEYCAMGIEWWDGDDGKIENVHIEDNVLRFSGYGWGQRKNDRWIPYMSGHITYANHSYSALDVTVKNNIFDVSRFQMFNWPWKSENAHDGYVHEKNIYYQKKTIDNLVSVFGPASSNPNYYAENQAEFEAAVAAIDSAPKLVVWLDDHPEGE